LRKLPLASRGRSRSRLDREAKELLANAKRSHGSIVDLISKLPSEYDARGYGAKARIIEGVIDEMEKQILADHGDHARGA
jgi:hypothetical protein